MREQEGLDSVNVNTTKDAMIGDLGLSKLLVILFFATPFGLLIYMFWVFWTRARGSEPDSIGVQ